MSAETLGHATDCPNAAMAKHTITEMTPADNVCSAVNSIVSAMPADNICASPNLRDNLPVSAIWLMAATMPVTAKALPTCCGPQENRACVHNPNTYSVPLNAHPARNVTSISRAMAGVRNTLPITAQRLGPCEKCSRCTRLSGTKRKIAVAQIADKPEQIKSGKPKPAKPPDGCASNPPTAGPTMKPMLYAAPSSDMRPERWSGVLTSAM